MNEATRFLFKKYPDPAALAGANLGELRTELEAVNFGSAKARFLIAFAQQLLDQHGGHVPRSMEELVAFPGIGRKIANVILGTGFGLPSGIVVDTHVIRLSQRLGLLGHKDPLKIERDLLPLVPEADWIKFSHMLQAHGRAICTARRPKCSVCPLNPLCPKIGVTSHD